MKDGGDGGRVVRGKLRIDRVWRGQHRTGAGQIRHVGVVLVRENRVVRQAQLLRTLDLGIPVSALDQAAHQAQLVLARNVGDVRYQFKRTRLVGLQRQAKTGPLRVVLGHLGGQRLQHIQRQLQPVHLFSVNREVDIGPRRLLTQTPHARHQLGHDTGFLRIFKSGVQRTQLDGDTVILLTFPRAD